MWPSFLILTFFCFRSNENLRGPYQFDFRGSFENNATSNRRNSPTLAKGCRSNQIVRLQKYGKYYGNTGCGVFKRGFKIRKIFCIRINIPKGNYWILSFGLTANCQKVPKFDFQSQFLCQNHLKLSQFFFHWRLPI